MNPALLEWLFAPTPEHANIAHARLNALYECAALGISTARLHFARWLYVNGHSSG